jgi:Uma2 family endonuclease
MHRAATRLNPVTPPYVGLRMTAEEFRKIQDETYNYELIDGVVVVSPSPSPQHHSVTMEIAFQIKAYLREHLVGAVFPEIDVHLGRGKGGGDIVYKPEVVFIRAERLPQIKRKICDAPDVVVEVISSGSRRMDTRTKKDDYERFGVGEYWVIAPEREILTFYRLQRGRFVKVATARDSFASKAVPGFILDFKRVRGAFKPW